MSWRINELQSQVPLVAPHGVRFPILFCYGGELPHLNSGQLVDHYNATILQRVQSSSMLHFSRDSRMYSLVTLLRGARLSSSTMGF
jgi:hypothetical protein